VRYDLITATTYLTLELIKELESSYSRRPDAQPPEEEVGWGNTKTLVANSPTSMLHKVTVGGGDRNRTDE
jgi:hypothetical protein